MERVRKQINNLSIRSTKTCIQVIAPDKTVLEKFDTLDEAETYAKSITEFKHKKKENSHILANDSLFELCDFINELRKLKTSQIGSIEYYHSITENAIVQICNESRGFKVLRYGTEKELKQYLLDILNNTTITIEI